MPGAMENCAHGTGGGICGGYAALHGPAPPARPPASVGSRTNSVIAPHAGAVGKASRLCRAHRGAAGQYGHGKVREGPGRAGRPPGGIAFRLRRCVGMGFCAASLAGASSTCRALAGEGARETLGACRALRAGESGYLRVNGTKVGSCACRAFAQESGQCAARWCHPCRAVACLALGKTGCGDAWRAWQPAEGIAPMSRAQGRAFAAAPCGVCLAHVGLQRIQRQRCT